MTAGRYLTPEAKDLELTAWEESKRDFGRRTDLPEGPLGGKGFPDPGIYRTCDRLNLLPGVCTLQSCEGHAPSDADGTTYVYAGQLWLWLDAQTAAAFEQRAPELAASPLIERLRKLWLPEGREVVDVEFKGGIHLRESTELIVDFFSALPRTVSSPDTMRLEAARAAALVAERYADRQELAPSLMHLAQAVQLLAEWLLERQDPQ